MQIDLYNRNGEKSGKITLKAEIFEADINKGLIHQALVMQNANGRQVTAKTKTRGEVRGGGRKPWRQKGTGRARVGSTRNPVWIGGGVAFGPTGNQSYVLDMPKKQRRKALFSMLSQKALEKSIIGLEDMNNKVIKTKDMATTVAKLPIEKSALIVLPKNADHIKKALNNIPFVEYIESAYLNVRDLLKYETLIFVKSSLDEVNKIWAESAKDLYKKVDKKTVKAEPKKEEAKTVEKKEVKKDKPATKKKTIKKASTANKTAKKASTKSNAK